MSPAAYSHPPILLAAFRYKSHVPLQELAPHHELISPLPSHTQLPYQVEILRHSTDSDSVGSAICERARKLDAALVVLSKHNKGVLQEFFVGSVTNYCESRFNSAYRALAAPFFRSP